jgi:hypothetical protein
MAQEELTLMHSAKRTARTRARTTFVEYDGDLPNLAGFDPGPGDLAAPRVDVPHHSRERAALMVLAVAYGQCPEEIARGVAPRVLSAFDDELERDEAFAHVDLLLEVLQPLVAMSS